jgi:hypothetical protein
MPGVQNPQAAVSVLQALHRFDGLAVQRGQQLEAAVGGHIVHARAKGVQFAHQHHASSAIPFRAALLGTRAVHLLTQIVQHGSGTALALRLDNAPVQHKADGISDFTHGMLF